MIQELTVVGIDVSKARFDVFIHPAGKEWSTGSSPTQISALIKRIQALGPVVVGLEASGGYERELANRMHAAGLKVYILPPSRVRNFANAMRQLADKIDARMLARMDKTLSPPVSKPVDPARQLLKGQQTRRDQLVAMRQQERLRLHTAEPFELDSIGRHLG